MAWSASDDLVYICSSANGGLSIGILCLSRRISGFTAQRGLESVGANVRFLYEWRDNNEFPKAGRVDLLVIVGGIDSFSSASAKVGLGKLDIGEIKYDRLIYAGHRKVSDVARSRWPHVEIVSNLLSQGLRPDNVVLPSFVRDSYLEDIESKRDIINLRALTADVILPTPVVVSDAFVWLRSRLVSPVIMFDVGGATTDLHFTQELLDEDELSGSQRSYPPLGRHVYTAYGVFESRASTIRALCKSGRCVELLAALYGSGCRSVYMKLLDGDVEERLLFIACVFLALQDIALGIEGVPPVKLGGVGTLALTGGAAKCIGRQELEIAFKLATGRDNAPQMAIDAEYRWWSLGFLGSEDIPHDILEQCY